MRINMRGWQLARDSSESWRSEQEQVCAESRLFDSYWYLRQNPRVAASGMPPLAHYIRLGAAQGLDPNPLFDTDWYLKQNPDVAAAGMNPLFHYIRWGAAKGLDPARSFRLRGIWSRTRTSRQPASTRWFTIFIGAPQN